MIPLQHENSGGKAKLRAEFCWANSRSGKTAKGGRSNAVQKSGRRQGGNAWKAKATR